MMGAACSINRTIIVLEIAVRGYGVSLYSVYRTIMKLFEVLDFAFVRVIQGFSYKTENEES